MLSQTVVYYVKFEEIVSHDCFASRAFVSHDFIDHGTLIEQVYVV